MATTAMKARRFQRVAARSRPVNGNKNVQSTARRKTAMSQMPPARVMSPLKGPGV